MLKYLTKKNSQDEAFEMADEFVEKEGESNKPKSPMRGQYKFYTPEMRYNIGKHAAEYGNKSATQKFSTPEKKLSESTVRGMKKKYYEQLNAQKKRKVDDTNFDDSDNEQVLTPKKRGRKVMLGEDLDKLVQQYITGIRKTGGIINTSIVMAAAKGIVTSKNRLLLFENGGHIEITRYMSS